MTITLPPETERLARQVAARIGRTPEDVLKNGLDREARIAGVAVAEDGRPVKRFDPHRVSEIVQRIASLPLLDQRSSKDILDEAWGIVDDCGR